MRTNRGGQRVITAKKTRVYKSEGFETHRDAKAELRIQIEEAMKADVPMRFESRRNPHDKQFYIYGYLIG